MCYGCGVRTRGIWASALHLKHRYEKEVLPMIQVLFDILPRAPAFLFSNSSTFQTCFVFKSARKRFLVFILMFSCFAILESST